STSAHWRFAQQVGKRAGDRVVLHRANGCQAHVLAAYNVVATETFDRGLALDPQRFRSARQVRREAYSAAPSPVFSAQQRRDLSELAFLPLCGDLHWSQPQTRSALPGGVDLDEAGIGEIEIRPHRLSLEARAPGIFCVLPKRHVRIRKREGLLRLPQLEIDASPGGFKIRERRTALGSGLSRRSHGNLRVALEQARQIPSAFLAAHQVDAGLGGTEGGDLNPSAEQGTKSDGGRNFLRADHRLRAKFGIVVDDEPLQVKARPRQKMNSYVVERHLASQSASDGTRNPVSHLVNGRPEQKQNQHESRDRSHPALGTKEFHRTILSVRDQRVSSKK